MSPCLHVPEFHKKKTKLTENGNFRLFTTNGKRKRQTSGCLLQTETEACFPWFEEIVLSYFQKRCDVYPLWPKKYL
jgi:hypothetical protein